MGICSKAKDIICCNQLTNIPIYPDIKNPNNDQKKNKSSEKHLTKERLYGIILPCWRANNNIATLASKQVFAWHSG